MTEPNTTYTDIAQEKGIKPGKFEDFMKDRFGKPFPDGSVSPQYAAEWAERIRDGHAYKVADDRTEKSLDRAGYSKEEMRA